MKSWKIVHINYDLLVMNSEKNVLRLFKIISEEGGRPFGKSTIYKKKGNPFARKVIFLWFLKNLGLFFVSPHSSRKIVIAGVRAVMSL